MPAEGLSLPVHGGGVGIAGALADARAWSPARAPPCCRRTPPRQARPRLRCSATPPTSSHCATFLETLARPSSRPRPAPGSGGRRSTARRRLAVAGAAGRLGDRASRRGTTRSRCPREPRRPSSRPTPMACSAAATAARCRLRAATPARPARSSPMRWRRWPIWAAALDDLLPPLPPGALGGRESAWSRSARARAPPAARQPRGSAGGAAARASRSRSRADRATIRGDTAADRGTAGDGGGGAGGLGPAAGPAAAGAAYRGGDDGAGRRAGARSRCGRGWSRTSAGASGSPVMRAGVAAAVSDDAVAQPRRRPALRAPMNRCSGSNSSAVRPNATTVDRHQHQRRRVPRPNSVGWPNACRIRSTW